MNTSKCICTVRVHYVVMSNGNKSNIDRYMFVMLIFVDTLHFGCQTFRGLFIICVCSSKQNLALLQLQNSPFL